MKLVEIKCPNCGSSLNVSAELATVTCDYCGSHFITDSAGNTKTLNINQNINKNEHIIYEDMARIEEANYKKIKSNNLIPILGIILIIIIALLTLL